MSEDMNKKRSTTAATATVVISTLAAFGAVAVGASMTEKEWVCLGSAYRCLATTSPPEQKVLYAVAAICFLVAFVAHRSKSSEERAARREAAGLAEAKFNRLRPKLIQQARARDGGCRECRTSAGVDVYYTSMGPTQDKLQRFEWLMDTNNMVTLCPQHTKVRNTRVAQMS